MSAIKVPSHIRDAPLPEGYVWHDGDEKRWPVLKYEDSIGAIATNVWAHIFFSNTTALQSRTSTKPSTSSTHAYF